MKITVFAIFLILLLPCNQLCAKENLDLVKGNYYYAHLAFYDAIPYYERVAVSGGNIQVFSRLGDCYRLTGNMENAAKWYKNAIDTGRYTDIVLLRYGQMLMGLAQYEEAAKWLMKYQKNHLNDRRVANLIAGCWSAPEILKKPVKGNVVLLEFNTDHSEFAPTMWNGNLVFSADTAVNLNKKRNKWTGNSYYNIYAMPCDGSGNCDGDYIPLGTSKNVNIRWHDGPCTFNAGGDTMYFTRTRYNDKFYNRGSIANKDSIVVLETMIATEFDEATLKFNKVSPFVFNSTRYSVAHPTISPNGSMLIFSSTMLGSGPDIYMCFKNKIGKWLRPQKLDSTINTEGDEVFPFFADDSTLFFASDGHEGLGGLDIYVSHWDKVTHTFTHPTNVGAPINSSYDDISMALFSDGTGGYFSSNRPAEKKSDNIYFYKKE